MLTALYEDREILVIDKPAGLPSQGGAGIKLSLVEAVERDFGFRPHLVHRLDRETSGCIIVARDSRAANRWTEMIAGREIGKFYLAIVAGLPVSASGILDAPVRVRGEEKQALTRYSLLRSLALEDEERRFALLELELGTGRTHQIRQQLAGAGLPILADDAHGDFALNKEIRKSLGLRRLCLHARRLVLPGGRSLVAELPEHMATFLARFDGTPSSTGGGA